VVSRSVNNSTHFIIIVLTSLLAFFSVKEAESAHSGGFVWMTSADQLRIDGNQETSFTVAPFNFQVQAALEPCNLHRHPSEEAQRLGAGAGRTGCRDNHQRVTLGLCDCAGCWSCFAGRVLQFCGVSSARTLLGHNGENECVVNVIVCLCDF